MENYMPAGSTRSLRSVDSNSSSAGVKEALLSIAKLCNSDRPRENCRDKIGADGIGLIQNVIKVVGSGHDEIRGVAMYSLGCAAQSDVFFQKKLCNPSLFAYLCNTLNSDTDSPSTRSKQLAAFLALSLVARSASGQLLLRQSGCLDVLLKLFLSSYTVVDDEDYLEWIDDMDRTGQSFSDKSLWSTVTAVLSASVNNPQNDDNQRICSRVFPEALAFLQKNDKPCFVKSLTNFLSLTVANNFENQRKLYLCGGLEVVKMLLYPPINFVGGLSAVHCELMMDCIKLLDVAVMSNRNNADACRSLGIIRVLLRLLNEPSFLTVPTTLQIMLALIHCTEDNELNADELISLEGVTILMRVLVKFPDKELMNAISYLLTLCAEPADRALQEINDEELDEHLPEVVYRTARPKVINQVHAAIVHIPTNAIKAQRREKPLLEIPDNRSAQSHYDRCSLWLQSNMSIPLNEKASRCGSTASSTFKKRAKESADSCSGGRGNTRRHGVVIEQCDNDHGASRCSVISSTEQKRFGEVSSVRQDSESVRNQAGLNKTFNLRQPALLLVTSSKHQDGGKTIAQCSTSINMVNNADKIRSDCVLNMDYNKRTEFVTCKSSRNSSIDSSEESGVRFLSRRACSVTASIKSDNQRCSIRSGPTSSVVSHSETSFANSANQKQAVVFPWYDVTAINYIMPEESSCDDIVFKKPKDVVLTRKHLTAVRRSCVSSPCCSEFDLNLIAGARTAREVQPTCRVDLTPDVCRLHRDDNISCPGCRPAWSPHIPLLTSRTINQTLDTSSQTCAMHCGIRALEQKYAADVIYE